MWQAQGTWYAGDVAVLKCASGMMSLVQAKCVGMRTGASVEGMEQTVMGREIIGFTEIGRYMPFVVIVVVQLTGAMTMLLVTTGASGLVGVAVMLIVLIVTGPAGKRVRKYQMSFLDKVTATTGTTNEIVSAARCSPSSRSSVCPPLLSCPPPPHPPPPQQSFPITLFLTFRSRRSTAPK